MTIFKSAAIVSQKAYTWFVGFFLFLFLLVGSFFRLNNIIQDLLELSKIGEICRFN